MLSIISYKYHAQPNNLIMDNVTIFDAKVSVAKLEIKVLGLKQTLSLEGKRGKKELHI